MTVRKALGRIGGSVAGGASFALGAQLFVYLIALIGSILVARALGPSGRGAYYLPVAAALTAVAVLNLAVEVANTYLRAERQTPLRDLTQTASMIVVLIAPLALALMFGVYELERDRLFEGVNRWAFLVVAISVPLHLHLLWLANVFLLDKRLPQSQLASVAGAAVQFVGIVALFFSDRLDVTAVLVLYAVSIAFPWLLHVWWARSFVRVRPSWNGALIRSVLATGAKIHVGLLLTFLLLRADVFLVGSQLGAEAVGIYSLSVLYAEMIWLLVNPLVAAVLPFQTEATQEEAGRLSFKAARFNLVIGVLMASGFAATCWFVFPVVYGEGFRGSYDALVALLPGVLALTISRPLANWLIRQGRHVKFSAIAAAAFIANIGLNLVFIPRFGVVGASLASSMAYIGAAAGYVAWGMRVSGLGVHEALWPQTGDIDTLKRVLGRLRAA